MLEHRLAETGKRLMRAGGRVVAEARLRVDGELDRATQALRTQLAKRRRALDSEQKRLAGLHPRAQLHRDRAALAALQRRLWSHPPLRLERARAELDRFDKRLDARLRQALEKRRRDFTVAVGQLEAMSPLRVLRRGYSLTRKPDGTVVTEAAQVAAGEHRQGAPVARRARLRSTIRRAGRSG